MQEVTCSHCGRHVQITPDAARCSWCGEDLQTLLIPQNATAYFYRRSADLAARGDLEGALAEAERGIDYYDASELRLLAAILSKRMGDMGTLRFHVAAIPVDDRLRQEAEWLIRAQSGRAVESSERPRKPYGAATTEIASSPSPLDGATFVNQDGAETEAPPANPDRHGAGEVRPTAPAAEVSRGGLWVQRMWAAVAVSLLLVAGAMGWVLLNDGPDALLAMLPGAPTIATPTAESVAPLAPVTPAPLVLPTATPQGTPTVPAEFVSAPESAPVADSGFGALLRANTFDLATVLADAGHPELAALDLSSQLNGGEVRVSGIVTNTTYRESIVETVGAVHGVVDVNASELLVRVPVTYTVQEGDSLWQIVTFYYGTDAAARVTDLYSLNRDVLPSASSLQVGMELQMPVVD